MGKEHYFGGAGDTQMHPAALILLLVAIVLLLVLPRRYVFIPLLVASLFLPATQQIMLGSLHLTVPRILLLFGFVRLAQIVKAHGRMGFRWNQLDTVFLAYCLVNTIAYWLLWADAGALVNRLGFLYNSLGIYFFMRFFVRDARDLHTMSKTFAWIAIFLAIFMLGEQATRHNIFSMFGGVSPITELRGGRLRAEGPFAHPLVAGTVGAALFPLMAGLWWKKPGSHLVAFSGCVAAITIAICSMSSTPILALLAGIFALCLWPMRKFLRWFRWSAIALLVCLHMVMKAPVWALIARIDLTGNSSSYHRFQLVDQFILRFSEWWLVGTRTTYNWGWDMWDTINSYVAAGTDGGLITFLLFIAVIGVAFRELGIARKASSGNPEWARLMWVLGAMLFVHSVAFFGIGYFDQSAVAWHAQLAMIGSAVSFRYSAFARPSARPKLVTDRAHPFAMPRNNGRVIQ